jgi:hypothetical protein
VSAKGKGESLSSTLNRDEGREGGEAEGCGDRRLAIDGRRPSREVGPRKGRENEGGGKARGLIAKLLRVKDGKRGWGKPSGRGRSYGGARPGGAEK